METTENASASTELTSTQGSVLTTERNDATQNPTGDSVPSSSSDANLGSSFTKTIQDDPISSTSDSVSTFNFSDEKDVSKDLVPDTYFFSSDLNIEGMSTEKISEDVEDIANDLENLLGETNNDFIIPVHASRNDEISRKINGDDFKETVELTTGKDDDKIGNNGKCSLDDSSNIVDKVDSTGRKCLEIIENIPNKDNPDTKLVQSSVQLPKDESFDDKPINNTSPSDIEDSTSSHIKNDSLVSNVLIEVDNGNSPDHILNEAKIDDTNVSEAPNKESCDNKITKTTCDSQEDDKISENTQISIEPITTETKIVSDTEEVLFTNTKLNKHDVEEENNQEPNTESSNLTQVETSEIEANEEKLEPETSLQDKIDGQTKDPTVDPEISTQEISENTEKKSDVTDGIETKKVDENISATDEDNDKKNDMNETLEGESQIENEKSSVESSEDLQKTQQEVIEDVQTEIKEKTHIVLSDPEEIVSERIINSSTDVTESKEDNIPVETEKLIEESNAINELCSSQDPAIKENELLSSISLENPSTNKDHQEEEQSKILNSKEVDVAPEILPSIEKVPNGQETEKSQQPEITNNEDCNEHVDNTEEEKEPQDQLVSTGSCINASEVHEIPHEIHEEKVTQEENQCNDEKATSSEEARNGDTTNIGEIVSTVSCDDEKATSSDDVADALIEKKNPDKVEMTISSIIEEAIQDEQTTENEIVFEIPTIAGTNSIEEISENVTEVSETLDEVNNEVMQTEVSVGIVEEATDIAVIVSTSNPIENTPVLSENQHQEASSDDHAISPDTMVINERENENFEATENVEKTEVIQAETKEIPEDKTEAERDQDVSKEQYENVCDKSPEVFTEIPEEKIEAEEDQDVSTEQYEDACDKSPEVFTENLEIQQQTDSVAPETLTVIPDSLDEGNIAALAICEPSNSDYYDIEDDMVSHVAHENQECVEDINHVMTQEVNTLSEMQTKSKPLEENTKEKGENPIDDDDKVVVTKEIIGDEKVSSVEDDTTSIKNSTECEKIEESVGIVEEKSISIEDTQPTQPDTSTITHSDDTASIRKSDHEKVEETAGISQKENKENPTSSVEKTSTITDSGDATSIKKSTPCEHVEEAGTIDDSQTALMKISQKENIDNPTSSVEKTSTITHSGDTTSKKKSTTCEHVEETGIIDDSQTTLTKMSQKENIDNPTSSVEKTSTITQSDDATSIKKSTTSEHVEETGIIDESQGTLMKMSQKDNIDNPTSSTEKTSTITHSGDATSIKESTRCEHVEDIEMIDDSQATLMKISQKENIDNPTSSVEKTSTITHSGDASSIKKSTRCEHVEDIEMIDDSQATLMKISRKENIDNPTSSVENASTTTHSGDATSIKKSTTCEDVEEIEMIDDSQATFMKIPQKENIDNPTSSVEKTSTITHSGDTTSIKKSTTCAHVEETGTIDDSQAALMKTSQMDTISTTTPSDDTTTNDQKSDINIKREAITKTMEHEKKDKHKNKDSTVESSTTSNASSALQEKCTQIQPLVISIESPVEVTEDSEILTPQYSSKMSTKELLKMTITKHKIDSPKEDDSILKIYDPKEDKKHQKGKECIPKLIIKPVVRSQSPPGDSEQSIPKLLIRNMSPNRPSSPKVSKLQKNESSTSLKVTIKPILKPDENQSKSSPKLNIKPVVKNEDDTFTPKITIKPIVKPEEEIAHSPRITIKPIPKPEELPAESPSPRITIKPLVKPDEEVSKEEDKSHNPRVTIKAIKNDESKTTANKPFVKAEEPRITIKPIPKPEEHPTESPSPRITIKPLVKPDEEALKEEDRSHSPRVTIKPIKNDETKSYGEEMVHSPRITIKPIKPPEEEEVSPKITIKPLVKPKEEERLEKKEGSPKIKIKPIVKPTEDPSEMVDFEEQIKQERIVLKINTKDSRKREASEEIEKLAKIKLKFSKEGGRAHIVSEQKLKRNLEESHEAENKRQKVETVEISSSPDCKDIIEIKDDSNPAYEDPIESIPTFEIKQAIAVQKNPPPVPNPVPKKRGRPRKIPLVVREEFKDPREEEPEPAPVVEESGRPKRSCRGPSVCTTLGIKPRKPRGGGTATTRGRGRGRGSRGGSRGTNRQLRVSPRTKLLEEEVVASTSRERRVAVEEIIEIPDDEPKEEEHPPQPLPHMQPEVVDVRAPTSPSIAIDSIVESVTESVAENVPSEGGSDVVLIEEETRMSADIHSSRAQTPAKQVLAVVDIEDTQSSVQSTATTESVKVVRKSYRSEVHHEPDDIISPEQLAEYYWGGSGPYMLQEQVAQFLGIKSFKRKYPGIPRRPVDMQERDFIRETSLASEAMCDMGLTAVASADILDIMYSDFQHKYEEYCKHQRDRHTKDIINKQKALNLAASQEKSKQDLVEQAVQSAASWNTTFNKSRKEERRACMDLQTFTVNYPRGKFKNLEKPKVGSYPIALVPGQYTDSYKEFTPNELYNLPLNTMMNQTLSIVRDDDSQSDGSGSDSDTSTSDSDSSSSDSTDEDCNICAAQINARKVAAN